MFRIEWFLRFIGIYLAEEKIPYFAGNKAVL